jgi:hypothetical protein
VQCPAGFDLTSYNIQVVGGEIVDNDGATVLEPEQTALTVILGDSGQMKASYLVKCGSLSSPLSNEVTVTIESPEPEEPSA